MNRLIIAAGLLAVFVSGSCALANGRPAAFPKGTLTLQTYATYAGGIDADSDFGSAAFGAGYYVWDNVSLSLEASGYRVFQSSHDAWAYGIAGVLRHHIIQFDRTTIYADVAFGPVEATRHVPEGGTNFNFITRAGLGATYQIRDRLNMIGGVRYFHLSNARLEGSAKNPSINGVEGYVGLMWSL